LVSQGIRGVTDSLTEKGPEVEGPQWETSGVFSATGRPIKVWNAATVMRESRGRLRLKE